jgi:Cys-tRNA(Pro)/Cys-tRNA(Cys) deacylase
MAHARRACRPDNPPMPKTNAVRLLERDGIPHELRAYEVDPDDLAAETVAAKVGLPPAQVFKTLVVRGDRSGILLAVVPGDAELDPKALARATGDRKVEPVKLAELQPLTGYIRGGVTAIACKKPYPVVADDSIRDWPVVSVSAGTRGLQVLIAPDAYLRAVTGTTAPIARPKGP